MRILFCNYEYPPIGGGGGVVNAWLAEELAKTHDVTVLTSKGLGLDGYSEVNGVSVVRVPVFFRRQLAAANFPSMLAYLPSGMIRGRKLISANSFDIINTHFALPSGPVGSHLANFGGLPNVLSVHGGDLYDPSKWTSPHKHALLRAWIKKLLRGADGIVGQSSNTLNNMQEYYTPELTGDLIPLGIQRPAPRHGKRSEYGFKDEDHIFITIGRLVARKAVEQIIDALGETKNPRAKLIVIGSGPLEKKLYQQAREAQLADRVFFMGQVDEATKLDLLSIADVFVSSSQHEGFGIVFLEAMAAGLPIICYDHGGQTDFLEDDKTGSLVPLNDSRRLAEALNRTLSDEAFCRKASAENLLRVDRYFIDSCAAQYERLFERIISSRATP